MTIGFFALEMLLKVLVVYNHGCKYLEVFKAHLQYRKP